MNPGGPTATPSEIAAAVAALTSEAGLPARPYTAPPAGSVRGGHAVGALVLLRSQGRYALHQVVTEWGSQRSVFGEGRYFRPVDFLERLRLLLAMVRERNATAAALEVLAGQTRSNLLKWG
jgi:hypothetical protein